jgi:ABC-type lipoprotein release transport system permease subunit
MRHTSSLAVRSLLARPLRALLTTFGIVLGVAVILAIRIANASTLQAVTQVFTEASGKAHLVVNSAGDRDKGFAYSVLRQVQREPGIQAAVPSLQAQTSLADDAPPSQMGMSMLGTAAAGLVLYGIDPAVDGQVRDYKLISGALLSGD